MIDLIDSREEKSVDELITVSSELIDSLRTELDKYFSKIQEYMEQQVVSLENTRIGNLNGIQPISVRKMAVIDGGSNVFTLNVGMIGICASVALLFNGDKIEKRRIGKPEIVPNKIEHITLFSEEKSMRDVLDRLREAKVFELASEVIKEWKTELLIIDGPLIPPGALFPPEGVLNKVKEGVEEIKSLRDYKLDAFFRFKTAVYNAHTLATNKKITMIGFVKRPHSLILARSKKHNWKSYDHLILSRVLNVGEFYPCPPLGYPIRLARNAEFIRLLNDLKPKFTYIKMNESCAPFRVDFGPTFHDVKGILRYLFDMSTLEGIPYPVMKADEETKIGSQLIREIHDELIHDYIKRIIERGRDIKELIAILSIYGGGL